MLKRVTPLGVAIMMVLGFFGGHLINTGWEAYRCEEMLVMEEEAESRARFDSEAKYKFSCKIPMYGLEWVYEDDDD